jgi:hypothetical protein
MPSGWHLVGLLLVPLILILTVVALKAGVSRSLLFWLYLSNGYLCAVSFWYTLAFALLTPSAVALILFYGIGLLPLAPLLSLCAAILQNLQLNRYRNAMGNKIVVWRWWLAGAAIAAVVFYGGEVRRMAAFHVMDRAMNGDSEVRSAALENLRRWGFEDVVLENCYPMPRRREFREWHSPTFSMDQCQALYYRLTGRDYREAPKPYNARRQRGMIAEIGGDAVDSWTHLLTLENAAVDVSVASSSGDAGPGAAYAELTLEFLNRGAGAREARCKIIMPPGGVASRLTLWIDGEEREAAFGRRRVVEEAYRQVTARRRDPALLTTAGPDCVLLQCFPVNPNVPMKVKVGFTLPLIPDGSDMALQMPYLADRNFTFAPDKTMAFWAESRAPMSVAPISVAPISGESQPILDLTEETRGNTHTARGWVYPNKLASVFLRVPSPEPGANVYRGELSGLSGTSALTVPFPLEKRLVAVVLDTSQQCGEIFRGIDWVAVLKDLPDGVRVAFFAGASVVPPMEREAAEEKWPETLKTLTFIGGDEQTGNLEKAWDLCAQEENGVVLWLHGTFPVNIADTAGLEQRLRRRPGDGENGSPLLLSLQMRPGANGIEEKLSNLGLLRVPVFYGLPPEKRLSRVFAQLLYPRAQDHELVFALTPLDAADVVDENAKNSNFPHVVRLALAGDIARKLRNGARTLDDEMEAARKLRLVTPLTGAVVLETQEQYAEHDLNPASNAENVPTIPEPEEWALFAIVLALLLLLYWQRKVRSAGEKGSTA